MQRLPFQEDQALSVSELSRRIARGVAQTFPQPVRVVGEVSKFMLARSGHAYFDLKDAHAVLRCICWASDVQRLDVAVPIADGVAIEALGDVQTYALRSEYQLCVRTATVAGLGDLHRQFEALKARLAADGLFDAARKRPIPQFVREVALVTSKDGAVLHDVVSTCEKQGAHVTITVIDTPVHGSASAPSIARAIEFAGRLPVDVVIVARGGGSLEDLWAFNTELVARAVARCARPVISAVGHETDVTICDFVADERAATPTAAAARVSGDRTAWLQAIGDRLKALARAFKSIVGERAQRLDLAARMLSERSPQRRLQNARERLARARKELRRNSREAMTRRRERFAGIAARLAAVGPQRTVERGYAIVRARDGAIVSDASQARVGQRLDVSLRRGRLDVEVESMEVADVKT